QLRGAAHPPRRPVPHRRLVPGAARRRPAEPAHRRADRRFLRRLPARRRGAAAGAGLPGRVHAPRRLGAPAVRVHAGPRRPQGARARAHPHGAAAVLDQLTAMATTRRDFLKSGAALGAAPFVTALPRGSEDRALVIIDVEGGWDYLSMLVRADR